jgi:hypothetical protein
MVYKGMSVCVESDLFSEAEAKCDKQQLKTRKAKGIGIYEKSL